MQPLSIGLVTPGYASRHDPGLPAVTDLVSRLAALQHVRVISLRHPAARRSYELSGATIHPLGGGVAGGLAGRARLLARAVARVQRLHRERPFDVLHALWADEAGAVAVYAGRLIGRPVVVSVLGGELSAMPDIGYGTALGRGGRWTVGVALRGADLVTVGSSTLRHRVARRVPADRLALHPLGVDLTTFSPGPPSPGTSERTILHVGSLEPVKDQVTLLRAFARVAADRRDVRLVICGEGSLRRALERLAGQLGVGDRVDFRGQVPRERLPERYRSATLLAVSSRWEAQSMVAVEAAACGIPVVGTRVGCLPDLGGGALTVPIGDPGALAEAVGTVLDHPAIRKEMSSAARSVAGPRFGLEARVTALTRVYRAVRSSPEQSHSPKAFVDVDPTP